MTALNLGADVMLRALDEARRQADHLVETTAPVEISADLVAQTGVYDRVHDLARNTRAQLETALGDWHELIDDLERTAEAGR